MAKKDKDLEEQVSDALDEGAETSKGASSEPGAESDELIADTDTDTGETWIRKLGPA